MMTRLTLGERIELRVREWPQWSWAERRRMDDVVAEVLECCRSGVGSAFIAVWCERNPADAV